MSQSKYIGNYSDQFGNSIELNTDSTFKYEFKHCLAFKWAKGKWDVYNDTIRFAVLPSNDSVVIEKEKFLMADIFPEEKAIDNLYYRNKKLFSIKQDGRLHTKKVTGLTSGKKYAPFYKRLTKKEQSL